jgi:hypothetical protein
MYLFRNTIWIFHVLVRPFLGFKKGELWPVRNAINMSTLISSRVSFEASEILTSFPHAP